MLREEKVVTKDKMPRPGNKSKAFVESTTGPLHAYLAVLQCLDSDFLMAEGFKESADMIVSNIKEGKSIAHPEKYFLPIAYLYRHGIELTLKCIIKFGIELKVFKKIGTLKKLLGKHALSPLWDKAKQVLLDLCSENALNGIENVERLIKEFHDIDPSGQNLRYAKDKHGNSTLEKMPKSVCLGQLKTACTELFSFFDKCDAELSAAIDAQNAICGKQDLCL